MTPEWTLIGNMAMVGWFNRRRVRLRHRSLHGCKLVGDIHTPLGDRLGDILEGEEGLQIDLATLVQILRIDVHEAHGRHMHSCTLQYVSLNRQVIKMNVLNP